MIYFLTLKRKKELFSKCFSNRNGMSNIEKLNCFLGHRQQKKLRCTMPTCVSLIVAKLLPLSAGSSSSGAENGEQQKVG
jgi:hypothetical protein